MRRQIAWCLVLGVFFTVGVSWCLSLFAEWGDQVWMTWGVETVTTSQSQHEWAVATTEGTGWSTVQSIRGGYFPNSGYRTASDALPVWISASRLTGDVPAVSRELRQCSAFGWPFIALSCDHEWRGVTSTGQSIQPIAWGIDTGASSRLFGQAPFSPPLMVTRVLPLRPHWRGFLGNTFLNAIGIWLVVFVPLTLFRSWRSSSFTRAVTGHAPFEAKRTRKCAECGAAGATIRGVGGRLIRQCGVSLVGGLAVTWIVAWGFALLVQWDRTTVHSETMASADDVSGPWQVERCAGPGWTSISVVRSLTWRDKSATLAGEPVDVLPHWLPQARAGAGGSEELRHFTAFGWPFIALSCEQTGRKLNENIDTPIIGGIDTEISVSPAEDALISFLVSVTRVLPLKPAWAGLLGDTLIFGFVIWLIVFLPINARRCLGSMRCLRCGYPFPPE